jgi:hypothetical protein
MTRPSGPPSCGWSSQGQCTLGDMTRDLQCVGPQRRSEPRGEPDAGTGPGPARRSDGAAADPGATIHPAVSRQALRRFAALSAVVLSNALSGVLSTIIVALAVFLWAHFHASHPLARHVLTRPAATAPHGYRSVGKEGFSAEPSSRPLPLHGP